MNNLNTALLEGTLKGKPNRINEHTCGLTLVSKRNFLNFTGQWEEETSEFSAVVYGPVADTCMKVLKKGRIVRIVGRLKQYFWKDCDGEPNEKTMIVAEHIEFMPEED